MECILCIFVSLIRIVIIDTYQSKEQEGSSGVVILESSIDATFD